MEEELKEIVNRLNNFSDKYGFHVYVECFEYKNIRESKKRYVYSTRVVKPEDSKF